MKKIFHLTLKNTGSNFYYGSLTAAFLNHENLGVSKFTIDRFDLEKEVFENEICTIRKGVVYTTGDIRNKKS